MNREEILSKIVEDRIIPSAGYRIDKLKRTGKLTRKGLFSTIEEVIQDFFKVNRSGIAHLGYHHWSKLMADIGPILEKNHEVEWNRDVLPGMLDDTSEFFEDAELVIHNQSAEHQQDLWQGIGQEFGGHLYPKLEKYRRRVEWVARYFMKLRLSDTIDEARRKAASLHYYAFYNDVMGPWEKGKRAGQPKTIDDLGPRYLAEKIEPGKSDLSVDDDSEAALYNEEIEAITWKRLADLPDALLIDKEREAIIRIRLADLTKEVERTGSKTRIAVLKLMLEAEDRDKPYTQVEIGELVGVRQQTAGVHYKKLRLMIMEEISRP
jgi:hypothetical protein